MELLLRYLLPYGIGNAEVSHSIHASMPSNGVDEDEQWEVAASSQGAARR